MTNTLVQAELATKNSIFCNLPVGVELPMHFDRDVVLKWMKSLFGMKDATKLWFLKAKKRA